MIVHRCEVYGGTLLPSRRVSLDTEGLIWKGGALAWTSIAKVEPRGLFFEPRAKLAAIVAAGCFWPAIALLPDAAFAMALVAYGATAMRWRARLVIIAHDGRKAEIRGSRHASKWAVDWHGRHLELQRSLHGTAIPSVRL
jgi:hypothetical protein